MKRALIPLLPLLALCLPAEAAMPGGIALGDKAKDVRKKIMKSSEFEPLDDESSAKPEENCRLAATIGGQVWVAEFVFDKRSKGLSQLVFIGSHEIKPGQAETLLKPFYVYTADRLIEHFKLGDPINTPAFGKPASLKARTMHPLHAHQGSSELFTIGLWKDKKGDFRICFSMQPSGASALGSTFAANNEGKPEEWNNIPLFESTPEGKQFLFKSGLAGALTDDGDVSDDEVSLPDEGEEDLRDEEEEDGGEENEEDEEEAAEPAGKPVKLASPQLPQVEQDVLNGLLRLEEGKKQEGFDMLLAAAKAGNGRALYELHCGFSTGKYGFTPNEERASRASREAARAGFALCMVDFGAEYPAALEALGLTEEEGKTLLDATLEGAKGHSPSARFNLAIMLRYGYGIRKDVPKAIDIMKQLIREGDPAAAAYVKAWEQ